MEAPREPSRILWDQGLLSTSPTWKPGANGKFYRKQSYKSKGFKEKKVCYFNSGGVSQSIEVPIQCLNWIRSAFNTETGIANLCFDNYVVFISVINRPGPYKAMMSLW